MTTGELLVKSDQLHTIYLCLIGDFTKAQEEVLRLTREYLGRFFDSPVVVLRELPLAPSPRGPAIPRSGATTIAVPLHPAGNPGAGPSGRCPGVPRADRLRPVAGTGRTSSSGKPT